MDTIRVSYKVRRFSVGEPVDNNKNIKIDTSELARFKAAMNRVTGGENLV